jgi:hypothetical protein
MLAKNSLMKKIFRSPFARNIYPIAQLDVLKIIPSAAYCSIGCTKLNSFEYKSKIIYSKKTKKIIKIGVIISNAISAC